MATAQAVARVLDPSPIADLGAYDEGRQLRALLAARAVEPSVIVDTLTASGLRGRGGAGFPTGVKWRTVAEEAALSGMAARVVVNAAEGEPGTYKDRLLLERNPYRVLEGALIAAHAVGAAEVVVALKSTFTAAADRLRSAVAELADAGHTAGVRVEIVAGPEQYLFGEETAMLEAIAGRPPFPRVIPPYLPAAQRNEGPAPQTGDGSAGAGGSEDWTMQGPVLVNNTETIANVAGIILEGPEWFRSVGTDDSPGTVVCTVTGRTKRHGVAEVPMGTTLGDVIRLIGGGALDGHRLVGAMSGVANAVVPVSAFDTPLTHEAMRAIGSGLGAAGFIVFDDETDLLATTRSASRFLAVESCGQCEPCKGDGLAISALLDDMPSETAASRSKEQWFADLDDHLDRITDEARCTLALQHQTVVRGLLDLAGLRTPDDLRDQPPDLASVPVLPVIAIDGARAVLDESAADRNPDWTTSGTDSGAWPATLLATAPEDA